MNSPFPEQPVCLFVCLESGKNNFDFLICAIQEAVGSFANGKEVLGSENLKIS